MMANNMMSSPISEREYIRSVAKRVWDDGVSSGRSRTDTSWYLLYMQGFQRMLEEETYKLIDEIEEKENAEQSEITTDVQDDEDRYKSDFDKVD